MDLPTAPRPSYADVEALPPHITGQIAFGVLHTMPRPCAAHSYAAGELFGELRDPFAKGTQGPGGWRFLFEPEISFGEHLLVPDVAGWRTDGRGVFPTKGPISVRPDWVCEVLSPSTQRFDRTDKLAIYAAFGVGHCWYVDPLAKTLEVLERREDKWLIAATFKDVDTVAAVPFEVHAFALDLLWLPDDPVPGV